MKTDFKTIVKSPDVLFVVLLVIVFLALGVLISWLGWWSIPVILMVTLYIWSWKWGVVVSLAALWAFLV